MLLAIPLFFVILGAVGLQLGRSPLPPVKSDAAFFVFVALVAFIVGAYFVGRSLARRFFRRSQVRFFRSYRHQ
jgi:undecaprenyl pyrophosphate phosphatase UppP